LASPEIVASEPAASHAPIEQPLENTPTANLEEPTAAQTEEQLSEAAAATAQTEPTASQEPEVKADDEENRQR